MALTLPTIVFVAGGFANPSCFDEIAATFGKEGYPTTYATVPSLNSSDARNATTSLDAQHVRENVLLPLINEGKDIILVVHSYGGVVGGAAAYGLGKSSPSAKGGVIGFLCIPAVLTHEGQTLLQVLGGVWPPWLLIDYVCSLKNIGGIVAVSLTYTQPSDGLCKVPAEKVMEIHYNDMDPESPRKAELQERMIPHALLALDSPSGPPAWSEAAFDGRRGYIRTLDDQTNPVVLHDLWMKNSGVEWDVETMKAGHCPFISQPGQLSELCLRYFKKWTL